VALARQADLGIAWSTVWGDWVERARAETVRALKKAVLAATDPDEEGKWTLFQAGMPPELRAVVDEAEELAGEGDGRIMAEWLGRDDLTPGEVDRIRAILSESGALAETLGLVESLADRAVASLEDTAIAPEAARALRSLALLVVLRDA